MKTLLQTITERLPSGWEVEESRTYGIIISAGFAGSVTVDDRLRNFDLGCVVVRRRGDYRGAKWKTELADAAIAALANAEQYWKSQLTKT